MLETNTFKTLTCLSTSAPSLQFWDETKMTWTSVNVRKSSCLFCYHFSVSGTVSCLLFVTSGICLLFFSAHHKINHILNMLTETHQLVKVWQQQYRHCWKNNYFCYISLLLRSSMWLALAKMYSFAVNLIVPRFLDACFSC